MFVPWCNGSTPDFGSVSLGSNPGGTTIENAFSLIFRLKAFCFFEFALHLHNLFFEHSFDFVDGLRINYSEKPN